VAAFLNISPGAPPISLIDGRRMHRRWRLRTAAPGKFDGLLGGAPKS
jgi:hypothetical protein